MMDTTRHIILSVPEAYGAIPGIDTRASWESYRSVYLIYGPNNEDSSPDDSVLPSLVLKPLKLGAAKAFLTGELLRAGGQFFGSETKVPESGERNQDDALISGTVLPSLIDSPGGWNYLRFRGGRFLLTRFIKGREVDYRNLQDLQTAIRTMKIFHGFTRNLVAANSRRWSLLKFDILGQWHQRLREIAVCREMALRRNDDWSRRYLQYWPEFCYQALEVVREVESLISNTKAASHTGDDVICYHDWAFHNIIIDGEKAFLVDFDEMIVDRPVHDRANLIGRYLRLYNWSEESLVTVTENFAQIYEWQPGELHWLWIYLAFPYDFWMLGRQYFIEKQPWSRKYYQDQWERKIERRHERRRILQKIRSEF